MECYQNNSNANNFEVTGLHVIKRLLTIQAECRNKDFKYYLEKEC